MEAGDEILRLGAGWKKNIRIVDVLKKNFSFAGFKFCIIT
jgi:hypothetical protein